MCEIQKPQWNVVGINSEKLIADALKNATPEDVMKILKMNDVTKMVDALNKLAQKNGKSIADQIDIAYSFYGSQRQAAQFLATDREVLLRAWKSNRPPRCPFLRERLRQIADL